ncbi:heat shock 70 kDa protein 18-like [Henckelia pumila]|uniref:heat shock 70 kDa protein 18-like n=1 Tax=Henckelia pumila TaxID=405737 RepID=UPI003C6DFD4E
MCFDIDVNGILTVTARDQATGNANGIAISNVKRMLSQAEVSRMLEEAKKLKLEDEEHKKRFQAKNSLEDYVYNARAATRKLTSKLGTADAKKIESEIESAMEWLDDHKNAELYVIENKRKELEDIWEPILTKLL